MQTETPVQTTTQPLPPGKGLLINRNFALLAVGQAISNIGDFVYSTTLLVWVFALTHSPQAVSGVVVAQFAPVFLLGPIAGVFVDRWHRRHTMVISDGLRVLFALLPLLVPAALRLPTIYLSVFLISGFSRFFMPAKSGVLQVIVSEQDQPKAASISQATFALAFVVGPALASPLYFLVGPTVAILINAASFLISAISVQAIQASRKAFHPYSVAQHSASSGGVSLVLRELWAGFRFVAKTRTLLMIVIMALVAMLGSGALNALDIIFVTRQLHVSTELYGPLTAVGGLGTLLGAILAGVVSKWVSSQRILTGGVLLLGIGIVLYAFQTQYLIALIINFIMCIPQGGIDVGFGPLLIKATPKMMIGRALSVIETGMYGMSLISISVAGYVGQFVSVSIIFAVCGGLIALGGLFGWFALPEQLPSLQERE